MPTKSEALKAANKGMETVDDLMSYASDGRGKPSAKEKSLYAAAIAFIYAVWETYVEDVAIETVNDLAYELQPHQVPEDVATRIEAASSSSMWKLAVNPGWRGLWKEMVENAAKGSAEHGPPYGLNTASKDNAEGIFSLLGIAPVPDQVTKPEDKSSPTSTGVPERINTDGETVDTKHCLTRLIDIRGQVVHAVRTEETIHKHQVFWWQQFIQNLVSDTDSRVNQQTQQILAS